MSEAIAPGTEPDLSLAHAAAHLGWSRRMLIRALVRPRNTNDTQW
jgi:hypothetical protein